VPEEATKFGWRVTCRTPCRPLSAAAVTETLIVDSGKTNIAVTAYNGPGLLTTPLLRITIDKFGIATTNACARHRLTIGTSRRRRAINGTSSTLDRRPSRGGGGLLERELHADGETLPDQPGDGQHHAL
jgi:hypothetical protein